MQTWIQAETKGADLGDERLNRRLEMLLERFNDKPDAAKILKPHHDATVARIKADNLVIVAQDTTEIELTCAQTKVGGPLSDEWHWGLYLHPLLAMTPERVPLGLV